MSSHRSKHILVALALMAGCATEDVEATTAQAVGGTLHPSGPYTDWTFSNDLYNLDAHTIITVPPPSWSTTEFWSTQFGFRGGDGGYMGIQNAGQLPGGGTGKMAIVSIWGAVGASPLGGSTCSTFTEGGSGYTCRLAYNWLPGHDYRTRAWVVGTGQWLFAIADMNTGVESQLGVIRVPSSWGWISRDWVGNWTEYFAANDPSQLLVNCTDLPQVQAVFSLSGQDGAGVATPRLLSGHVSDSDCHNTTVTMDSFTATRQTMGGPVNSWLASGQSLSPNEGIWSQDGRNVFINQGDGNIVLYHDGRPLWASWTNGPAGTLVMQTDGNLVLYRGPAVWATNTSGRMVTNLVVQNDCNVVLYQNNTAVWHTQTYGCQSRL